MSLHSLLQWKCERLQSFSKDNTTFSMFQTLENRQEEERKLLERRKSRQLDKINLSQLKLISDDTNSASHDNENVPRVLSNLFENAEELSETNNQPDII